MDLSIYLKAAAGGVPILFVVWGIVQLLKKLTKPDGTPAVTGNLLLVASLATGLILGLGYWIFETEPPPAVPPHEAYAYWFAGSIYGLGLGLLASLFWDALKVLVDAAIEKLAKKTMQQILNPPGMVTFIPPTPEPGNQQDPPKIPR